MGQRNFTLHLISVGPPRKWNPLNVPHFFLELGSPYQSAEDLVRKSPKLTGGPRCREQSGVEVRYHITPEWLTKPGSQSDPSSETDQPPLIKNHALVTIAGFKFRENFWRSRHPSHSAKYKSTRQSTSFYWRREGQRKRSLPK